jgi:membrane protein DedA with SNARE-associated domain
VRLLVVPFLADITGQATRVIDALGNLGWAVLVAIENISPPIPSEDVVPLAGFSARRGEAHVGGMIAAATVGPVVGAWLRPRPAAPSDVPPSGEGG